jgi:hypothetical protein
MLRITRIGEAVLSCLDWLVQVAERLIVLGLASAVLRYGYLLTVGRVPSGDWIASVAANWKAVVLILIPLFYRAVRTFLEQVEEAFGMKRPLRKGTEEEAAEPGRDEG